MLRAELENVFGQIPLLKGERWREAPDEGQLSQDLYPSPAAHQEMAGTLSLRERVARQQVSNFRDRLKARPCVARQRLVIRSLDGPALLKGGQPRLPNFKCSLRTGNAKSVER